MMISAHNVPTVLLGASLVLVQVQPALAQTFGQVTRTPQQIAKEVTILISLNDQLVGSGVLFARHNETYYVITCAHVIQRAGDYQIRVAGRTFPVQYKQIINLDTTNSSSLDIAVIPFESNNEFNVVELGDSDTVQLTDEVFISGYPVSVPDIRNFTQVLSGKVTSRDTLPKGKGYALTYVANTVNGMSGGPILDSKGRLVGIHGQDLSRENRFGTSTAPMKAGIPINTLKRRGPEVFLTKGKENLEKGRFKDAIIAFSSALKLNTQLLEAALGRGYALFSMDNFDQSKQDADRVIDGTKSSPVTAWAYMLRGAIYERRNEPENARVNYDRAVEIDANILNARSPYRTLLSTKELALSPFASQNNERTSRGIPKPQLSNNIATIETPTGETRVTNSQKTDRSLKDVALRPSSNWISDKNQLRIDTRRRTRILDIATSPDGKLLASASDDPRDNVRLWNLETGTFTVLIGHLDEVRTVAFSPHGRVLITGGRDGTIRLWNTHNGQQIRRLPMNSQQVHSVAFSRSGQTFAVGLSDGTIQIFTNDSSNRTYKTLKGHKSPVLALTYSNDGKTLASGGEDSLIQIWDAVNPTNNVPLKTLNEHKASIQALTFKTDGTLVSGSKDRTVRLWKTTSTQAIQTIPLTESSDIWDIAFHPNGNLLAIASRSTIQLVDLSTQKTIETLAQNSTYIRSLSFNPTGSQLFSGDEDSKITLWKARP